jgi:hypothetical protein
MNKAFPAQAKAARIAMKQFRAASWLIDAEPYSRQSDPSDAADLTRLKVLLKHAVERNRAPQTLIDSIKGRIRNADESR